ncbi:hypothetical protein [Leptolyngbya sp. O-77]|uniref:hypothetical protein n=1 Tax=Leptolyngbya sp. O-77 TaxID=1080068 RepID=UPI00074D2C97|nr:hypothetical protein [Leptolyngbya sp. O-77]BAU44152.1 hypothetical protein O77CONTIG1_03990 [Leptolyngbya sp. O-77]
MPYSATLRRVLVWTALPLAIAALGSASGAIAQAQPTLPDPLQPAVPFPTEEPEPGESAPVEPPAASPSPGVRPEAPVQSVPAPPSPASHFPRSTQRRSPAPFSGSTIFENLTLTPGADPSPKTIRGISGGPLPASDVAGRPETATGPCLGFVDTQPDHILTLTAPFEFLSLQVQSAEDTTLVVKGPGGSWCNDNYLSLNPGIAGQWLPGRYEIWIGSHRNNGYFPYLIRVLQQPE